MRGRDSTIGIARICCAELEAILGGWPEFFFFFFLAIQFREKIERRKSKGKSYVSYYNYCLPG